MYFIQSGPPDISSTHLAPYLFIIILLTVFSMLYFTSPGLFCDYQFILLNPFIFFIQSPTAAPHPCLWPPSATPWFILVPVTGYFLPFCQKYCPSSKTSSKSNLSDKALPNCQPMVIFATFEFQHRFVS